MVWKHTFLLLSLWCWWLHCILFLAPEAKLRKSSSWHVEANASHQHVVAKLHGKRSLARSLEIRLIVTQKPQGGRRKQYYASEYHCTPDCTTGKSAWKRNTRQHAPKYFHHVHGFLVVRSSVELMNVLVPVTTRAIDQNGEKGYDWHK